MTGKNMALMVAAQNVTETYERLTVPVEALAPEVRFGLMLATSINMGHLRGAGSVAALEVLNAAYSALTIAWWEHEEEKRKANEALKARQAADKAAAEAAANDPLMKTLDDVLADRPALYKVGDQLLVRYEKWDAPRAAEVSARTWRDEATLPAAWVYTLQTQGGTYTWAETDLDWDVDFHPHN